MQAGTEEISGLGEEERTLEEPQNEQQPVQESEEAPKESPKETVRRELEKLKNADGNESQDSSEEKESSKKPVEQKLERENDPDLMPPERLPDSQKALFSKMPKGLRREANKLFKSFESAMTKANQAASETRGLAEAIQPYASEWGMRGISAAQGVAQLAAAQAKLTDPNPEVRKRTFLALAKQSGVDLSDLSEAAPQKSESNELNLLREELQSLKSKIGTQESAQQQTQASAIVQELDSVRLEVDETSGDYRYPELHNEAYLNSTVKPLVSAIKGNVAGIGWADSLKVAVEGLRNGHDRNQIMYSAYAIATGKSADSHNSIQTRLPAAAINKPARVIAPVSVRGRIGATSVASHNEPPPEAMRDARATTAWALEQLRRR